MTTLGRKAAIFGLALALLPGLAAAEPLRIGIEPDFPPISMVDEAGAPHGLMVDVAADLCRRLQATCNLVPLRFDRLMPALAQGQVDAVVAAIEATDERRKVALFTPAFARSPARFVMRRGEADGYVSPSKLKGKVLAAQSGTTYANYLEDNYTDSTVKAYARLDEALAALAGGAVDAVLTDALALQDWLRREPGQACCIVTGPPLSDPKWLSEGFSVAVPRGKADLAERMTEAVTALRADGTFRRLNEAYAPFSLE
jgi:polar amino acid transport system substrate-binding protein